MIPRLARLALGGMLLSHLLIAAFIALVAIVEWWLVNNSTIPWLRFGFLHSVDAGLLATLSNNLFAIFVPYTLRPAYAGPGFHIASGLLRIVLAFSILLPSAYLMLPTSLRRAKVHRRHLLRVLAYWLIAVPIFAIVPPIMHLGASVAFNYAFSNLSPTGPNLSPLQFLNDRGPLLSLIPLLLFAWWFWSSASSRYLKLPHARFDAALLVLLAVVAALNIEFFLAAGGRSAAHAVLDGFLPHPH